MLRAVLDTNIIISGLNFGGNPRRVLQMAEAGFFRMAVSDFIMDELARVLRRERFGWPEEEIRRALNQIERFSDRVGPEERVDVIVDDPSDNRILECAAASCSDYVVSGDNHLLALGQYKAIRIVKSTDFISGRSGDMIPVCRRETASLSRQLLCECLRVGLNETTTRSERSQ